MILLDSLGSGLLIADQNNNSESSQEKAKTWWEKIFI
ncbi:MAG: hypothetical protein RBG13Loki_1753, partial [Promethearchaeota archaeon CR_4]